MPGAQISSRFLVVLVSIGIYCISNKSCDGFLMPHNTIPFSVKSIGPIDFTPTTGTRGSTSPIERDHNNVRCRTSFIPSWLNVGAESDDGFSVATVTGDEESEERERDENNDSDEDMVSRIEKYLSDSSSEEASVVSDDILDETERVVSDLISLGSQRGVTTAEKLLWHLVEEKERGNERAHPTIDLFNTVLYAHATLSSTPVDSALSLLTHLETHPSTTPTLHTYNTALSTLSHHSRRYRFADKKSHAALRNHVPTPRRHLLHPPRHHPRPQPRPRRRRPCHENPQRIPLPLPSLQRHRCYGEYRPYGVEQERRARRARSRGGVVGVDVLVGESRAGCGEFYRGD
mmetsp:Transcript_37968/g.46386  ORF Transcript_37968/g.46386 Transcript_37968/m.46386 type:complete len:346 (+) Transcript_37968:346-1383(+)